MPGPTIVFSGDGRKGAYGACAMVGWTAREDRPEFSVATGICTSAILALFRFLGRKYDQTIETLYIRYQTRDSLWRNYLGGLLGGNALDSAAPYRSLIDLYISDPVISEIASEAQSGRILLIGSADLDRKRPTLWNVTANASPGHTDRGHLIPGIIQASSAIPATLPPFLISSTEPAG